MKRRSVLAIVLAAGLSITVGCGVDERLSREEFSQRLQSIDQRGGEVYGRVADRAADLQPDQPLPADITQPLGELVEFQRQAARELETINPPEGAQEAVETLTEALHERTETIEQAIEAGRFTRTAFDHVTESGEKIDEAFAQLRNQGFLPEADEHEGT